MWRSVGRDALQLKLKLTIPSHYSTHHLTLPAYSSCFPPAGQMLSMHTQNLEDLLSRLGGRAGGSADMEPPS